MSIKAALLDGDGVFLRVDELEDESQLTERHLPQITSCDLQTGKYKWVPAAGAFVNLAFLRAQEEAAASELRVIARKRALLDEREQSINAAKGKSK